MQATINYTGRRKLLSSEVQVTLNYNESSAPVFDVDFSLNKDKLPNEATIYIEAYQKNTLQRFHFGTVGMTQKPANRTLNEIDLSTSILFRVRIVDETEQLGRLTASVENLKAVGTEEDQRASLLPVRSRPLGQQTWKLNIESGMKPELCINSRIPDAIEQLKSNPQFQSLILPAAFKQVLMYFLWNDEETEIADEWFRFAEHISHERPLSSDPLSLLEWIDDVIEEFSNSFELCDLLKGRLELGAS